MTFYPSLKKTNGFRHKSELSCACVLNFACDSLQSVTLVLYCKYLITAQLLCSQSSTTVVLYVCFGLYLECYHVTILP